MAASEYKFSNAQFLFKEVRAERTINFTSRDVDISYHCLPCKMTTKLISDFVRHRHGDACQFKPMTQCQKINEKQCFCSICGMIMSKYDIDKHHQSQAHSNKHSSVLKSAISKKTSPHKKIIKKLSHNQISTLMEDAMIGISTLQLAQND